MEASSPTMKESTPIKERWLVKMFSPPSINKVSHQSISPFYTGNHDQLESNFCQPLMNRSRLKQPTLYCGINDQFDDDDDESFKRDKLLKLEPIPTQETPDFRVSNIRQPSPNKFKDNDFCSNGQRVREAESVVSPVLANVKRRLEYNSPLKEKLLCRIRPKFFK